jgi:hypothetical protein
LSTSKELKVLYTVRAFTDINEPADDPRAPPRDPAWTYSPDGSFHDGA